MEKQKPLQQQAYDYLLDQITSGVLRPGVVYSKTRIAAGTGISRTPVRDALVRLSQDRMIDILPSRGFRLHQLTEEDVYTTFQARTAVEGYCALELAAGRGSAKGAQTLAALRESIEQLEQQIAGGQPMPVVLDSDLAFHKALVGYVGNRELNRLYETLNHRVASIALESFTLPGRPAQALMEHRAILRALCTASDRFETYRAVTRHMEASRDIVLGLLGRQESK